MTRADLIAWRTRLGWSKPQAAAALGMTYRGYQMLEAGDHALRTIHELACLELTRRASSTRTELRATSNRKEGTTTD